MVTKTLFPQYLQVIAAFCDDDDDDDDYINHAQATHTVFIRIEVKFNCFSFYHHSQRKLFLEAKHLGL